MRRRVRTLRHWKQRFHRDAEFIWRRSLTYGGESCAPGDPIPDALVANKAKLRRFWESGTIELAQFEEPNVLTGQVRQPTASEDMVREIQKQQVKARAVAEAAAASAAEDFQEIEDGEPNPAAGVDDDTNWLDGSPERGSVA